MFGSSHGGVAVGTLALSDFASTAIVRIASSLILKGFHINYFHYFLFVMSGPISGFIVSAIFPPTDGDRARMERLKKGQCCSNEKEQEVRSRHEMENMPEQWYPEPMHTH